MAQYVPGWASGLWEALQAQISLLSTVQSVGNSVFTPLAANGVYTGATEDITKYAEIRISVFADQASATNGLAIEQSTDGINWDQSDQYTIPASTNKSFGVGAVMRYFRIVYTNGAVAQTAFRLTTKYNITLTKASSVRMQDARSLQNDFEEVAAYTANYNGASFDMLRSVINSTDSVGTGITAAGLVAQFDDTSPSTVTENQFGNVRMSASRMLYVKEANSFLNIVAGQATTVVKASAGTLHAIIFNGAATATNTTTVYDHPSGVGTVIGRPAVTAVTAPETVTYNLAFANGLTIITATANGADMTVVYS